MKPTTMQTFPNLFKTLLADESGQDLIEYALVAALVGLGAIVAMRTLSTNVNAAFTNIAKQLTNVI